MDGFLTEEEGELEEEEEDVHWKYLNNGTYSLINMPKNSVSPGL